MPPLPQVHYGPVDESEQELAPLSQAELDEDEEDDAPADADLIEMLGFDPDDLAEKE